MASVSEKVCHYQNARSATTRMQGLPERASVSERVRLQDSLTWLVSVRGSATTRMQGLPER